MKDHTKKWLAKAQEDEKVANILLQSEYPVYAPICFHLQQAAEKYLKSLIIENNLLLSKTHNIVRIIDESLLNFYPEFEELIDAAAILTGYGVEPRYPGDYPELTKTDSEEAFEALNQIKEAVLKKLKK